MADDLFLLIAWMLALGVPMLVGALIGDWIAGRRK